MIHFKCPGEGPLERDLCLGVRSLGGDFGRLRLGQEGLVLNYRKVRRKSDLKGLQFHFHGLLLKNAALDRGLVRCPSLPQGDICIGDFQANLILELLAPHFALADLQLVANGIRLRDAIPQG